MAENDFASRIFPATVDGFKTYQRGAPGYQYQFRYPAEWAMAEDRSAVKVFPRDEVSAQRGIFVVIINYAATPPPPVWYTYTPIRIISTKRGDVEVRKRDPSPATELYFASVYEGDLTAEIRFALDPEHEETFDDLVSSFLFLPGNAALTP